MKISSKVTSKVEKFQEGGAVQPAAAGAPQEQQAAQDPMAQLVQMAQQALQGQDCQAAMAVCDGFLQLLQSQGGGAPAQEQGAPVYKKGGRLVKRA